MSSEEKIQSNRRNAKRSTGPKSEGGKMRASQNALKRGLYAKKSILRGDEAELHADLLEDAYHQYFPEGPLEEAVVEQIVMLMIQIHRMDRAEVALLEEASAVVAARKAFDIEAPIVMCGNKAHRFDQEIREMLADAGSELPLSEPDLDAGTRALVVDADNMKSLAAINRSRNSAYRLIRECEQRLDALAKRRMYRDPKPFPPLWE